MSVFDEHRDELQDHELMLGRERGRLALTLDLVTNAMALVGQHSVYCHRDREQQKPAMDIQTIMHELHNVKEVIQSVMEDLRQEREGRKPS